MQGTVENTKQGIENQTREKADGPGFNGPAPAPQGGQAGQIDKRAIKAIINVIKRKRSFVFMYEDVMDELEKLIDNEDERDEIEAKLVVDIIFGEIKHLYMLTVSSGIVAPGWGPWNIIVASPIVLDDEQLAILGILAEHYDSAYYRSDLYELHLDIKNMRKRVYEAINAVIRAWSKRKPMDMVRILAEEYGVEA
jgi:hypothetical protein